MAPILLIFLSLIFNSSPLLAQGEEKGEVRLEKRIENIPNPLNLSPEWRSYFDVNLTTLEERIPPFIKYLQDLTDNASVELKPQISPLTQKAILNLNALLHLKSQTVEPLPKIPPKRETYSIQNLLDIFSELKNLEIVNAADKDDLAERKRQILTVQDHLQNLWESYSSKTLTAGEKLLMGLDLLDLKISLELAREKIAQIEKKIERDRLRREAFEDEIKIGISRLHAEAADLAPLEIEVKKAEAMLNQNIDSRRMLESTNLSQTDFSELNEEGKKNNQLLDIQVLRAEIDEAYTEQMLIQMKLKEALAQILLNPANAELTIIDRSLRNWEQKLESTKNNLKDWDKTLRHEIHRSEEWITLNPPKDESSKKLSAIQTQIFILQQKALVQIFAVNNQIVINEFLMQVIDDQLALSRSALSRIVFEIWDFLANAAQTMGRWINSPLFSIGDTVITLFSLLRVAVILLLAFWATRLSRAAIRKVSATRKGVRQALIYRIERLIHYFIIFIGILVALSAIGFDFSSFVIIAGALGVGLGFGLQALFNNFVCGLMILFENQLKVGDYVELESGVCGEVTEINFRSTYIKTNDGLAVVVPNSEFINNRLTNWTLKDPYRRVQIHFTVAYNSNKELVKKIVKEAVMEVPITLKKSWAPEPMVYIENLGEDGIQFKVSVWVDDIATKRSSYTQSTYLWTIHDALLKHGIEIPYPQTDLHVNNILGHTQLTDFLKEFKKEK